MATIKKKASQGEHNIIDLVFEVKKEKPRVESKESIEIKKKNIDTIKKINKRVSARISYIKKKIEKASPTDIEMLPYYEELDNFKRKGKASHKNRTGNIVTMTKYNIKHMVNELNKAEGKDYYYRINDGFNKPYNVKRSKILKMDNSSFFLDKFRDGVQKQIDKLESIKVKDRVQKKKLFILKDKLLKTIDFNSKLIKFGDTDEKNLPKEFRGQVDRAFSKDLDKEDKEGEYPITLLMAGELIEF